MATSNALRIEAELASAPIAFIDQAHKISHLATYRIACFDAQ